MLRFALVLTLCSVSAAHGADPVLERGAYLVERVGMCSDCHSPRDQTGQFIRSAWLGGAPVGLTPKDPIPGWAEYAPRLAGVPAHYTDAALVTFLETGVRPDGSYARPPMPPYRLSRPDAEAVVAYLRTLRTD